MILTRLPSIIFTRFLRPAINALNFLVYLCVARRYKGRDGGRRSLMDESAAVELIESGDEKGELELAV